MKKFYSFFTLLLISFYIFFLYFDARRIFIFITERYYYTILFSAVILFISSIIGLFLLFRDQAKRERFKIFLLSLKTDRKLVIVLVLTALGILLSPIFLLIAAIITLVNPQISLIDKLFEKDNIKSVLLVGFVILGVILPSTQISSATADQRINNLNGVVLNNDSRLTNSFNSNTRDYDIGDWITSLTYNSDLNSYVDKEVEVTGFIYTPNILPENMFIVGRFVIRCCAADATPVGLKVHYEDTVNLKVDSWVKVKGKFSIQLIDGFEDLVIIPESIEETEVPERPYIN